MTNDAQPATRHAVRAVSYDPGFRSAVEAGHLTAQQALQRGRRDQCAASLAARHGLTLELAFDVADNRVPLGKAIRMQRAPRDDPTERGQRTHSMSVAWLALGVPLVLFLGVFLWFAAPSASSDSDGTLVADVETDVNGRVTRVEADDARMVLDAYCEALSGADACRSVGLLRAAREAPRLRVGVLVHPDDPERMMAIPIQRDRKTGRWTAGNGDAPLTAMLAPRNAEASLELTEATASFAGKP